MCSQPSSLKELPWFLSPLPQLYIHSSSHNDVLFVPSPIGLLLLCPPMSFNWKIQWHFSDIALPNDLFPTLDHCKWSFKFFKSSLPLFLSPLVSSCIFENFFPVFFGEASFSSSSQDTLLCSSFLGTLFPFHIPRFSGDLTDSHNFNHHLYIVQILVIYVFTHTHTHTHTYISHAWKILKEMGISDHLICLQRNIYAGQE